ncbi:MAG: beta-ketoacyl-[acyl-carrier-protein] synthase family protein [Acidimicrobiaceae bacterium]|jgi:3-oxoacyl-[acyl-carrier-protein] synthase II|nr:beta-ketoacyl-[acyl-carrier-protein] synthase family protein [Actinomycetota bacterium]
MLGRRVAVTGIGVVAPAGIGKEAFWSGLLSPAPNGFRQIEDWDPSPYFDNPKEARRSDRVSQFTLAAAAEALEQAGEISADPARRGTFVGTGVGGIGTLEEQIEVRLSKGERRVSPFLVPMMMANAPAATISMRYGWQGPCENTVTACAAGTHAIGNAARMVADGRCDVVMAGGAEAPFTPTAVAGFGNMTALSNSGDSRPFDANRDGFVMAEGAAILVLEAWELAEARGATILGEVLGSASTADAHHITAPSPGGVGAVTCMQLAMDDAGITPDQVRHINAHGTSTDKNDAAEAEAVAKVFGTDDSGPLVTSTKGITGHALGAAGALEAVAVLLAMQHGKVPPTAGLTERDPELPAINIVEGGPADWEPGPALSNSFGFGGHNGTLVLGPA